MAKKEFFKEHNVSCNDQKVVCVLYDKVARKHFAPSTFDNTDCAVRDGEMLFKEHFGNRSKDYCIKHIASFDPSSGVLIPLKEPYIILDGSVFIFKDEEVES